MADKKTQVRQGLDGKAIPKFCLMFLGNAEVGKTSIIMQYMNNCFRNDYYPTKDFIIYKKLYNFNPDPDEIDEYAYVEIMDTMAFNKAINLSGYDDFYNDTLIQEREINPHNNKMPEAMKKKFKHDYSSGTENQRGLFSNDRVMGYVFVFDFNNERSFTEMLTVATRIENTEKGKKEDFSIKAFIGNKRDDILINEFGKKSVYTEEMILDSAQKEKEYYDKLKNAFNEDFAKDNLFFTSAKNNINIQKALSKILNKINQNEALWKKIAYEKQEPLAKDKKKNEGNNEEEEERGFFSKLFCCNPRRADVASQVRNQEEDILEEQEENMRFQDDDDEDGDDPDANLNFKNIAQIQDKGKPTDKGEEGKDNLNASKAKDEKSGCLII